VCVSEKEAAGRGAEGKTIVRKRFLGRQRVNGEEREGVDRLGLKEGCVERNVGKGRKEWRHFAEVDRERERDSYHTDSRVTMGNADRGAGLGL